MFRLFSILFLYLISTLQTNTEFIQPNASLMLYGGEHYDVKWNMSNNVNLQFQIYDNMQQDWVSHINDNHFLSIVIDQTTNHYNWSVPLYLSQYWQNPSRLVLNSLDTSLSVVSDEFNIAGIYVNMSTSEDSNIIIMNDNISITWETNVNSNLFNVSVYDNTTNYNNIKYRQPLYAICNDILTNESRVCNWDNINETGTFVIGVTSNKLYGMSSVFHVYYTPTSAPTLTPTSSPSNIPSSSPTPLPTNSPTPMATDSPTISPTMPPTLFPTYTPTMHPSCSPTEFPTFRPSVSPSQSTMSPSMSPETASPSASPSVTPNNNTYSKSNNSDNSNNSLWIIIGCIVGLLLIASCILYWCQDSQNTQIVPMPPRTESIGSPVYYTMSNQRPTSKICYVNAQPITSQTTRNRSSNLYPNIPILTHYGNTQFDVDERIVKNNTYERTSHDENIYNTLNNRRKNSENESENNNDTSSDENVYDQYNVSDNIPKENIVYDC